MSFVKSCVSYNRNYSPTSRHLRCPSCRKRSYKKTCPECGKLMQRKSKVCKACFNKSKQYPYSTKKHLSKNGYYYVYYRNHPHSDASGRVFEHRLVIEKLIGRYLLPFESVHHKNGIKTDNRVENLELWVKTQPTGARVEDLVKWAKEILKLYGDVSSVG